MTDNYSEINDELLALRVVLQEDESNESNIIRDLKMYLIAKNIPNSNINDIIFNFYQSFNINLSNEFISGINPVPNLLDNSVTSFLLNPSSFLNNNQQNDDDDSDESDTGDGDSDDDNDIIEEANTINENDIDDGDNDINEIDDQNNNNEEDEDNNENPLLNVIEEANMLNPNNNIISVMNELHQLNNMLSSVNNQNGPIILNGNPNNIFNFNTLNQPPNIENLDNVHTNPSEFLNILGDLISTVNNNSDMEDVKVTLDDNDLENLESNELTEDLNEKCSICMMEMKKGDKYTKLSCNHGFHTDCVMQWFKEYNYKCPVCRKECGNAKYHV